MARFISLWKFTTFYWILRKLHRSFCSSFGSPCVIYQASLTVHYLNYFQLFIFLVCLWLVFLVLLYVTALSAPALSSEQRSRLYWLINNDDTRMPSNLRRTTRECAHLVMRGHFRSRDKDGGHTTRSAVVKNQIVHANYRLYCVL